MPCNWHSGNCLRDYTQTVYSVGALLLRLSSKSSKKLTWTPCIQAPASPAIALQCQAHLPYKFQRVAVQILLRHEKNIKHRRTTHLYKALIFHFTASGCISVHHDIPASLNFTGITKDRSTWVCAWDRDLHISILWSTHIYLVCFFKMLKDPDLFYLCGCGGCNIYSHFQGDIYMLSFWRFFSESARTFTKIFLLQRMNRCVSQRWVSQTAKCMTVSSWWEIWQQVIVNPLSECGTQVWGKEVGKYPAIGSAFSAFRTISFTSLPAEFGHPWAKCQSQAGHCLPDCFPTPKHGPAMKLYPKAPNF